MWPACRGRRRRRHGRARHRFGRRARRATGRRRNGCRDRGVVRARPRARRRRSARTRAGAHTLGTWRSRGSCSTTGASPGRRSTRGCRLPTRSTERRSPLVAIGLHDVSPATWPECERLLELVRSLARRRAGHVARRAGLASARADRRVARMAGRRRPHPRARRRDRAARALAPRRRRPIADAGASLARRFLTAGEAEFSALDASDARQRIERGLAMLRSCGWKPVGFVPPAWQISEAAGSVLADFGFRYTTTLGTITALPSGACFGVPCLGLSARSPLRRAVSLRWNRPASRAVARTRRRCASRCTRSTRAIRRRSTAGADSSRRCCAIGARSRRTSSARRSFSCRPR